MLPALDGRAKVHVSVTHTKSAMKGLVSPREFCSCILEIREKDFLANAAHGLGRRLPSKYPPLSSHVRGAMHFWGCMLKRNPSRDGVWDMTMCMQVSVNGWVPSGPVMSETMKLQNDSLFSRMNTRRIRALYTTTTATTSSNALICIYLLLYT